MIYEERMLEYGGGALEKVGRGRKKETNQEKMEMFSVLTKERCRNNLDIFKMKNYQFT